MGGSQTNNNPQYFGPTHRPIVEFALENVQALRKRELKLVQRAQRLAPGDKAAPASARAAKAKDKPNKEKPVKEKPAKERLVKEKPLKLVVTKAQLPAKAAASPARKHAKPIAKGARPARDDSLVVAGADTIAVARTGSAVHKAMRAWADTDAAKPAKVRVRERSHQVPVHMAA